MKVVYPEKEPLQEWFKWTYLKEGSPHYVPDDLIYRNGACKQIMFVRDQLAPLVCRGVPQETNEEGLRKYPHDMAAFVISKHYSKSCPLPVYLLAAPGKGIQFVLRDNFYDWKVSVISDKPVEIDPTGLFRATPPVAPKYAGDDLSPVYFQGFPENLIFDRYSESDKQMFSLQVRSDYDVYMLIFMVMRALEGDQWAAAQEAADQETIKKADESRFRATTTP